VDEVALAPQPVQPFAEILGADPMEQFGQTMAAARCALAGRTVWHVNSTAEGGGVAEMLQSILGYPLDCGITVRWLVIDGTEPFFEVTKRLHHLLHGSPGDGGRLGPDERSVYESVLAANADHLVGLVRPGDAVILHDPQTLGLAPVLARAGARVIWSCHIGADRPNEHTRSAWHFLAPYTADTAYQVFSRAQYGWDVLDPARVVVIPPCIDAFSAKNQSLADDAVGAILAAAGVLGTAGSARATFVRRDGSTGRITAPAELIEDAPLPATAPIVTQISRWDPLKDHTGVLAGFTDHGPMDLDAHLVLAGPAPDSVSDDPEGQQTFGALRSAWSALPPDRRQRVHIACLPMNDLDENAAIVNALQRRSDVVVQKSLAEGFGLTVAEAMWKERPTIGSRVGGIQDQIEPDISGLLVEPDDLAQFGARIDTLLRAPDTAAALGRAARERVCGEYLAPRHLDRYFRLVTSLY
jgi:trehalose synthase